MSTKNDARTPSSYAEWRKMRLLQRLGMASAETEPWRFLITVVVIVGAAEDATALPLTLASLGAQIYRNIEVLVIGAAAALPADFDFSSHRGLFLEPGRDAIDFLADAACDRLWRGDYLIFAQAGVAFDPDAFMLLNAAVNQAPDPAPELVVCDHDRQAGLTEFAEPSFLPGWDPDLILSFDYIGAAFMASRALVLSRRDGVRPESLHDWLKRLAAASQKLRTGHIAETIMHIPQHAPSPQPLRVSLPPLGPAATMAIVIPNRNRPDLLSRCVALMELPNAFKPELVIVDNASDDPHTLAIYDQLRARYDARVVPMNQPFNLSRMINIGVAACTSDVLLLLNNDVEVTVEGLLEQVLAHARRPEVGVVGSRLLYRDDTLQHGGMLLGRGPTQEQPVMASHVLRGAGRADCGYLHQLDTVRNCQAITGAMLAVRREVFDQVGGFDEVVLPAEFNDVDFCLKVRRAGLRVIVLPLDGIYHNECASRGGAPPDLVMQTESMRVMVARWEEYFLHDPFRSPWVDVAESPSAKFPWFEPRDPEMPS